MKRKATLAALALLLTPALHAFTFDFASLEGVSLPPDATVIIGGYGSIKLYAGKDVTNTFETPVNVAGGALQFDSGDVFYIDFLGGPVANFQFTSVNQDAGENFLVSNNPQNTRYRIALSGPGAQAGIQSVSFDAATPVPEPTAAALGLLGALGFVIRRRR